MQRKRVRDSGVQATQQRTGWPIGRNEGQGKWRAPGECHPNTNACTGGQLAAEARPSGRGGGSMHLRTWNPCQQTTRQEKKHSKRSASKRAPTNTRTTQESSSSIHPGIRAGKSIQTGKQPPPPKSRAAHGKVGEGGPESGQGRNREREGGKRVRGHKGTGYGVDRHTSHPKPAPQAGMPTQGGRISRAGVHAAAQSYRPPARASRGGRARRGDAGRIH